MMQAELNIPAEAVREETDRPYSTAYRAYVLFALSVVGFMCAVDKVVISMFMEPMKKEFGLSDTQLGLLTGLAFALLGGLAAIPLARWADRGSRKLIINASFMAWTLMTAASGIAVSFTQLLIARIGVGIGEAGCIPATHSMLGDYYPRLLRGRAMGIHSATTYLGMLGGLLGGGILVQTIGWRSGFVALGLVGAVLSLLFHFTVREPARVDGHAQPAPSGEKLLAKLGDLRAFLYLVGAFSTTALAGAATMTWLPSYFQRAFALTPIQIGGGLGLCLGVATAIGSIVGGMLSVRYGARSRSWGAGFSAAITVVVMPFYIGSFHATNPIVAFGLLFMALILAGSILGPVFASLQDLVKPDARATAVAVVGVAGVVFGQGFGPVVVGAISDWLAVGKSGAEGLRWSMTAVAMVNWLTVLWFWLLRNRIKALPCP
ncbi:MAG TPA: MFS transporter [Burkholderiaceae bacterium]|jgi:MFS family permease